MNEQSTRATSLVDWGGAWIDAHQTLAGSLLGFAGVILTLLWNARQNRTSERKNALKQERSLLFAFYAEMSASQSIISEAAKYIIQANHFYNTGSRMSFEQTSTYMFQSCSTKIYDTNVDKLGLIGRHLSSKIVTAYSCVSEFEQVMSILTGPKIEDLRMRKLSGRDLAFGAYFVTTANDAIAVAISAIKDAMPEKYRGGLLMLPPITMSEFFDHPGSYILDFGDTKPNAHGYE